MNSACTLIPAIDGFPLSTRTQLCRDIFLKSQCNQVDGCELGSCALYSKHILPTHAPKEQHCQAEQTFTKLDHFVQTINRASEVQTN